MGVEQLYGNSPKQQCGEWILSGRLVAGGQFAIVRMKDGEAVALGLGRRYRAEDIPLRNSPEWHAQLRV